MVAKVGPARWFTVWWYSRYSIVGHVIYKTEEWTDVGGYTYCRYLFSRLMRISQRVLEIELVGKTKQKGLRV